MNNNRKDDQNIQFEKMAKAMSQTESTRPRIHTALAAIAVLIVALFAVWPTGSQEGITWPDVAERIASVETMTAMTKTVDSESRVMHRARIYFKDPGMSRTEVISNLGPGAGPESIMIIRREARRAEQLTLLPRLTQAHLVTHNFRGSFSERKPLMNMVAESWRRLNGITSSRIRTIGERRLEGVLAAGFEAPAEEFFGSLLPGVSGGTIRVWANRETGVPLRVELELQKNGEAPIRTTFSQIEWNAPVADEMFEMNVPEGWQLRRTNREVTHFTGISLADQVTFRIGAEDGMSLVSETDVVAVPEIERIQEVDSQVQTTTRIAVELSAQALARLRLFASENQQEPLIVDFNKENRVVVQLALMPEDVVWFDVSRLGLSLAEFEERYLTSSGPFDSAFAEGVEGKPLMPERECSSFILSNYGHPFFGTNFDHASVNEGLVFVNKRGMQKSSLNPNTTGEYKRWKSRFASITFNLVGFQFAWAGMNEKGLTLSTMSLHDTEVSAPDERPPLDSGEWVQFVLDTCATVDDLVASDAHVRIYTVDHYLVADSFGNCAVIEFLGGEMVVHTGPDVVVAVLTNSMYSQSVMTWYQIRDSGDYSGLGTSLARFCYAADRIESFVPGNVDAAVDYAFDTLRIIRGEDFDIYTSQWSIVFDTLNLRAWFRTHDVPEIRYLDMNSFNLDCGSPIQMLDLQAPLSGDVADDFFDFSYDINFEHTQRFMTNWGIDISTQNLGRMVDHFENFSCVDGDPRRPTGRVRLP